MMRRSPGFTLIEVMIALVIFSMIMLATISGLRTFARTGETVEAVSARADNVRLVSRFLRDSIAAAMPLVRLGSGDSVFESGRYGTLFWGGRDELIWVAPFTAGPVLGGTHVLRLSHERDVLRLWWQPYDPRVSNLDWDAEQSRVILENVKELSLGYRSGFANDWLEEWPGGRSNPVLVRIQLQAGGRYWPELVVALDQPRLRM